MGNLKDAQKKIPPSNPLMTILEKSSYWSSLWFERIAMVAIVGIIISTLIDVVGAKIFHKPMAAGTEVVYFLQIIAIAGALAFAKIDGRHIRLEFVDSFPRVLRGVLHFIAALLGFALFAVLIWESYEYGQSLRISHEVTSASRIAIFPFVFWMGLCCIPVCLVLLKEMVDSVIEVTKK